MRSKSRQELATAIEDLASGVFSVCRALAKVLREPRQKRQAVDRRPGVTTDPASPPRAESETRLLTVKQFAREYPAFSEGRLRWLLFNRQWNRFEEAIVQVGRRILIDTKRFHEWLELPNEERQARPRPL
jgi:hypothetical protein